MVNETDPITSLGLPDLLLVHDFVDGKALHLNSAPPAWPCLVPEAQPIAKARA